MTCRLALLALMTGLAPGAAAALSLAFPAPASLVAEDSVAEGAAHLPRGPFDGAGVAMLDADGAVTRQAWRLGGSGLTTGQIMAPLREQVLAAGYDLRFECSDRACGGFDFRFAADILGEPAMHVDLGDFRYLLADDDTGDAVALLVSRSPGNGFVHLTRVGGGASAQVPETIVTSTKSDGFAAPVSPGLLSGLAESGRAVLDDLLFRTGSADLETAEFQSLRALADYLSREPERNVALVGHTDATGALEGNIALSRRRAQAVADVLVSRFGIDRGRLRAEGVGFLAPLASNATEEGRRANRRVEIVLTE